MPRVRRTVAEIINRSRPATALLSKAMFAVERELGIIDSKSEIMNQTYWGRPFATIESMTKEEDPKIIAKIISNCELMHRRSIPLFNSFKSTILRTLPKWEMSDLIVVIKGWRELGYLTTDLLLAIMPMITENVESLTSDEIVTLLDAFATTRLTIYPQPLIEASAIKIGEFNPFQLLSLCSSLARLNVHNMTIISRSVEVICDMTPENRKDIFAYGQDVAIAVYSFAKLRTASTMNPVLWPTLVSMVDDSINTMAAAHLTMCITAFKRAGVRLAPLQSSNINRRVIKVMAEFSPTGLAILSRDMETLSDALRSRVIMHLPRILESASAKDIAVILTRGLLSAAAGPNCPMVVIDIFRSYLIQFGGSFTSSQRSAILECLVSHYGRDEGTVNEVAQVFDSVEPSKEHLSIIDSTAPTVHRYREVGLTEQDGLIRHTVLA